MAKPFDAILREIFGEAPGPLLEVLLRRPVGPARVQSAELSTVTAEADSVIRVDEPEPWLAHVEFQTSYDPALPLRMLRYNVLAHYRHRLPVRSIALLLCKEANGPAMTGIYRPAPLGDDASLEFRYNTIRLWEWPAESLLSADPAMAPLAAIADVSADRLPGVLHAIREKLEAETPEDRFRKLWTATYILMGLKFSAEVADHLISGVENMAESSTYLKILNEGVVKGQIQELKRTIKRLGRIKFGAIEPAHEAAVDRVADLETLERLSERVLFTNGWDELLGELPRDSGDRPEPR
ncbi:hypothetical protein OJF2_46340 [Aquisphaera giovannonii]|uniref:DUF4351 domain-containing protein n=1 Tax=Aquisphaera giovannonii TaxID=406548 RepID=A0A5B9W745_9BACT|nr:hypothetical protein [Aquisphaera giovannonii]QEH36074.1 hypothetical protein OJF2_46340 [Aquisphaera giovannonii]